MKTLRAHLRKAGRSGTGESKRRGDSKYYSELGKKGVAAREKRRAKERWPGPVMPDDMVYD